jgi:hypothetical protein
VERKEISECPSVGWYPGAGGCRGPGDESGEKSSASVRVPGGVQVLVGVEVLAMRVVKRKEIVFAFLVANILERPWWL